MFKKILLAFDGSEHALRATEKAIEVAQCRPDSVVHVALVIDSSKSDVLRNWNTAGVQENRQKKVSPAEEKLTAAKVNFQLEFLRGEPGPAIIKHANDNNFDIVVLGSRGLNGLQEFVLGSVSHKVAKRANCAVLLIK